MIGQCAVTIKRNSLRLIQLNHALVRQGGAADQSQVTVIDDGAVPIPTSRFILNAVRGQGLAVQVQCDGCPGLNHHITLCQVNIFQQFDRAAGITVDKVLQAADGRHNANGRLAACVSRVARGDHGAAGPDRMIGGVCRNDRTGAGLRAGDRIFHAAQHIVRALHRIPAKEALAVGGSRCVRNGGQRSAVSHGLGRRLRAVHKGDRPIRRVSFHRDRAGNEGHGDIFKIRIGNIACVAINWLCFDGKFPTGGA